MDVSKKPKRLRVGISLEPIVLKTIDDERGLIPRSAYINNILRKQLLPKLKEQGG